MARTVAQWAEFVGGTVALKDQNDVATVEIKGAATPEMAGPTDVAFLQDPRSIHRLLRCRAGVLLVRPQDAELPEAQNFRQIVVADPQTAFVKILADVRPVRMPARGIDRTAVIHPTATIGDDCYIGSGVSIGEGAVIGRGCDIYPGVVIGAGCQLGEQVTIYPNAVLYADCLLDDRVMIHANAVIGADGFGYRFTEGRFEKIPQLGWVHLHRDVEIGAGAAVDRGAIGPTVVGAGTKIDNMVQIAHNCQLGRHNAIAAQVGMAGSSSTGDYVRMAGQVGVADHVHMNTGCTLGAKAGVHKDIPAGETWIGIPAMPEADQKRLLFSTRRVPQIRDDLKALQSQVEELKAALLALLPASRAA
ncbi:MAG TPA: UDP-3-O-(3-hydroxymyristoyl)glucosamine N-acyltransferase [Planctomycetaceae bacterium]|jgi:UDP-3-O-[3-hydroxymyristoyl] glucosamine N-acyltransferase|nr:UDP-3-O-(3-hydroxymyristoyl)glucosamine N-acyltransferase [Planctomycetaceae bacterium]